MAIEESEDDGWARRTYLVTMVQIYSESARVKYRQAEELIAKAQELKAYGDALMGRALDFLEENADELSE